MATMTADDDASRRVAPDALPEGLPQADVLVTGQDVAVTVSIVEAEPAGIQISIEPRGLTISSLPGYPKVNYHVTLPVNVRLEAPQVTVVNGVVDVTMLRAYPRQLAKARLI